MITTTSRRLLISLAFIICHMSLSIAQTDYVDDINNATAKREAGHQVIYEMNVGSFTQQGTFAAAQERLGELKQMGVDIVWLMPIYPRGISNSPYAATNFQQTNPKYGTIADLKALVARAHELQMEVWLDWVPNHTATNADWVTTHPEYYATSGRQMIHPNNYGDVWQLNYSNSGLVNAMNDCLKFWIDQADIDGYRCDYISSSYIPTSYWQTAIPLIKSYKPGKTIRFLGEGDIAQDVARLANVGFDCDYAWQFQTQLANFGPSGNAAARLKAFGTTLLDNSRNQSFSRMLYVTNHDQNFNDGGRTLTQLYGNNRYALTVLTQTLYGMPLIYNGQETGGNQILDYFADTKVNWGTTDPKMLNTLRTLCAMKHDVPALADRADVEWVTVTNNTSVLAYTRKAADSEVLVVLNLATTAGSALLTGLTAGEWSLWLNSETIGQGTSRQSVTFSSTQSVNLDAKGYRVYVKGHFSEEAIPEKQYDAYTPVLDSQSEVSVFLETDTEGAYNVWTWGTLGGGEAYTTTGAWPGDAMTLMGKNAEGRLVYKYVQTKTADVPTNIIITRYDNGNEAKRLWDGVTFVNHGYYIEGTSYSGSSRPAVITATSGITTIASDASGDNAVYDLSGRKTGNAPLPRGIYVSGGKKFVVK